MLDPNALLFFPHTEQAPEKLAEENISEGHKNPDTTEQYSTSTEPQRDIQGKDNDTTSTPTKEVTSHRDSTTWKTVHKKKQKYKEIPQCSIDEQKAYIRDLKVKCNSSRYAVLDEYNEVVANTDEEVKEEGYETDEVYSN